MGYGVVEKFSEMRIYIIVVRFSVSPSKEFLIVQAISKHNCSTEGVRVDIISM